MGKEHFTIFNFAKIKGKINRLTVNTQLNEYLLSLNKCHITKKSNKS
jgi:hypothetical protein